MNCGYCYLCDRRPQILPYRLWWNEFHDIIWRQAMTHLTVPYCNRARILCSQVKIFVIY